MDLPSGLPEPTLDLDLRTPITIKGGTIATLSLREPTGQEMWLAEGLLQTNTGSEAVTLYMRQIVATVSGRKPEDLEAIRISELSRAYNYLAGFIEAGVPKEGEGFVEPEEETWELALPAPVTFDGRDYTTLSLSEPSTGATRKAQGQFRKGSGAQSARAYQMHLVANSADVPYGLVQRLPVSVLNVAASYLQGFIVAGPRTGTT